MLRAHTLPPMYILSRICWLENDISESHLHQPMCPQGFEVVRNGLVYSVEGRELSDFVARKLL